MLVPKQMAAKQLQQSLLEECEAATTLLEELIEGGSQLEGEERATWRIDQLEGGLLRRPQEMTQEVCLRVSRDLLLLPRGEIAGRDSLDLIAQTLYIDTDIALRGEEDYSPPLGMADADPEAGALCQIWSSTRSVGESPTPLLAQQPQQEAIDCTTLGLEASISWTIRYRRDCDLRHRVL